MYFIMPLPSICLRIIVHLKLARLGYADSACGTWALFVGIM